MSHFSRINLGRQCLTIIAYFGGTILPNLINASVLFDFRVINNLEAFMTVYPELAIEAARDSFNKAIKPHLLSELRYMPPKVHHPFVWTTERQRRAYFATDGFGAGIPYKRSGRMVAGWKVDVLMGDGSVVMSASNKARALKYVTGKRQQPGHVASGWPKHKETINFWAQAAKEEVGKALNQLVNQR